MSFLTDLTFDITSDQVLLGQGADPQVIRARRPRLVAAAERALSEGLPLVAPVVAYEQLAVREVRHERILLENGAALTGPLIARQLMTAQSVVAMLCTIGPAIEELSLRYVDSDPVHSLALYGVGSAATEALSVAACRHFGQQAAEQGLLTTIPLSPGLEGWPVDQGQPEIFRLIDAEAIGVQLLPSFVMRPIKSTSLVVGIGKHIDTSARICDFCARRYTCSFQDHYGQ
jgi:hypothetical protein